MPYKPPTKVTTREVPYLALVTQFDPMFERRKHYDVEYQFKGRNFMADPTVRGAYNQHSNTYPVGQQFGANDPAYADRPFYSGVPTGPWA